MIVETKGIIIDKVVIVLFLGMCHELVHILILGGRHGLLTLSSRVSSYLIIHSLSANHSIGIFQWNCCQKVPEKVTSPSHLYVTRTPIASLLVSREHTRTCHKAKSLACHTLSVLQRAISIGNSVTYVSRNTTSTRGYHTPLIPSSLTWLCIK